MRLVTGALTVISLSLGPTLCAWGSDLLKSKDCEFKITVIKGKYRNETKFDVKFPDGSSLDEKFVANRVNLPVCVKNKLFYEKSGVFGELDAKTKKFEPIVERRAALACITIQNSKAEQRAKRSPKFPIKNWRPNWQIQKKFGNLKPSEPKKQVSGIQSIAQKNLGNTLSLRNELNKSRRNQ